jgi:hypothetical protein
MASLNNVGDLVKGSLGVFTENHIADMKSYATTAIGASSDAASSLKNFNKTVISNEVVYNPINFEPTTQFPTKPSFPALDTSFFGVNNKLPEGNISAITSIVIHLYPIFLNLLLWTTQIFQINLLLTGQNKI